MENPRVALRQRWSEASLRSTLQTLEEQYQRAMEQLNKSRTMSTILEALDSLEYLSELHPVTFTQTAPEVVDLMYRCMRSMNRSISCVAALKSAATVLANLTRSGVTGPNIYAREHIPHLLKIMMRFSITIEVELFLILATDLWLYSKYDSAREDLTEYLHTPGNHKLLVIIKQNVDRMKRMLQNGSKNKPVTHANVNPNASVAQNSALLPALEPDYGAARVQQPRYFSDIEQAMHCLCHTYKLQL